MSDMKVKFGASSQIKFYEDLVKELCILLRRSFSFTSDEVSWRSFARSFSHPVIDRHYQQWLREKVEQAFGCAISDEHWSGTVVNLCEFLDNHRTQNPIVEEYPVFLGIKSLFRIEGTKQEPYHLDHPEMMKNHVDYQRGWLLGKPDPEDEKALKTWQHIKEEFKKYEELVYGSSGVTWQILTIEGDELNFTNLYGVYCWLIARASNYSAKGLLLDW